MSYYQQVCICIIEILKIIFKDSCKSMIKVYNEYKRKEKMMSMLIFFVVEGGIYKTVYCKKSAPSILKASHCEFYGVCFAPMNDKQSAWLLFPRY